MLLVRTDVAAVLGQSVLPEQEIANWESSIHGIKQISDLLIFPDKRALDIRQPDFTKLDEADERRQVVMDLCEKRLSH